MAPARSLPAVLHQIIETSGSCLNLASLDFHGGLERYCRTSCPNDRCCSLRNPTVQCCTLPHLLVNKVLPTSLEGALVTTPGSPCFFLQILGKTHGARTGFIFLIFVFQHLEYIFNNNKIITTVQQ